MRGDVIFEVFGVHDGRRDDVHFGAFRTIEEAQSRIRQLEQSEGGAWARKHHNQGFAVRPTVVACDFDMPPLPKPRDKYVLRLSSKPNRPGTWDSTLVEVFRRGASGAENQRICQYERSYAMLQTFEPFRQKDREFALISRDYTRTAVLDLASGEVIAEEAQDMQRGFCPVGFFVPDWRDLHDGSNLPGSHSWSSDCEWPTGDFGFVWGCIWGDDSSWKVQYLDLRDIQKGVIRRDERFGYVELATSAYRTPCLMRDLAVTPTAPPDFISLERYEGVTRVTLAVEMLFDLQSGKPREWQRQKIANFE